MGTAFELLDLIIIFTIDGSTAIVTNERRARLRHSVKFLVRVAFENTVTVVQNSAYNCEITVHPRKLQHRQDRPICLTFAINILVAMGMVT